MEGEVQSSLHFFCEAGRGRTERPAGRPTSAGKPQCDGNTGGVFMSEVGHPIVACHAAVAKKVQRATPKSRQVSRIRAGKTYFLTYSKKYSRIKLRTLRFLTIRKLKTRNCNHFRQDGGVQGWQVLSWVSCRKYSTNCFRTFPALLMRRKDCTVAERQR